MLKDRLRDLEKPSVMIVLFLFLLGFVFLGFVFSEQILFLIMTQIIKNTTYHGIDLDLFIALFTASLKSLATCSSIPRVLARSDTDAFSSDLSVKPLFNKISFKPSAMSS